MSKNKWIRPVSFNYKNAKDQRRLKFIGKKSFATFVKKLIDEEMKRSESVISHGNSEKAQSQQQQPVIPPSNTKTVIPKRQQGLQGKPKLMNPMLRD
jgi:hypothetical protein